MESATEPSSVGIVNKEDSCAIARQRIIAIAGNPNVGKSTLFNNLTGMHQHTGNWPGKTVSNAEGYCKTKKYSYKMVDIPGTYSLMAHSLEEEVARDFLQSGKADAVIVVCDAACLERNLNLVLQTMEIMENVIVCVNMLDEAKKKGIQIKLDILSKELGIPVIGMVARDGKGIRHLLNTLDKVMEEGIRSYFCESDCEIPHLKEKLIQSRSRLANSRMDEIQLEEEAVSAVMNTAEKICDNAVVHTNELEYSKDRKLDYILTSKRTGYPIMAILLLLILWITIAGANYPSQMLAAGLFKFQDLLTKLFEYVSAPDWLHGLLVMGAFRVPAWVVSVMLPPMAIFFPLFTLLEDAGYLPRIAYNLDKPFKKCCACGKQALTLCMGFGCNAAGVTGCRIIDSPRERLIAILTNSLVPCNGRFPTLIAIIAMFFAGTAGGIKSSFLSSLLLTAFVLLGVGMTFLVSGLLSKTVLKGMPSSFTLEMPPYRRPQIGRVIIRSIFDRTLFVLGRAVAVAIPAGIFIWVTANIFIGDQSLLTHFASILDPFAKIMGMDGVILLAFILGLPANELVVPLIIMIYLGQGVIPEAGNFAEMKTLFVSQGWTWVTAICTMIFTLMHWPCSTTLLTIKKETGSIKWTLAALAIPTAAGMILCFVVAQTARLFM
ncbi:ferrous iron transport protein B [Clostridium sp. C105KSO13]|uniref:ferrous iron transport protein B n=1 Tax=Clostridium sp. C105KSO13 TaxID=1776045 RepID=UPI0007406EBC|nr:ferrous iron transport protein B [Clostridium sp. C105KSO13]CUX32421.1 Ferrous iron transport protein B [Clostridium sp. C105KSO13]